MENDKWNNVLIEWVNCLKLCKNIQNLNQLRNGDFFNNLQKLISKCQNAQTDNLTFIFDLFAKHYPNYLIENKTEIHLADLPETDLKAVISLLVHYTCIYDRRDVLTSPLCHSLTQSTQLIIRNFLQKITKDISVEAMNETIQSCMEDASDHLTNQWLNIETSSVKSSPLFDIFKTPVSKIGRLHEKDRIISQLKTELENERYEKIDLSEELKIQVEKNKKTDLQLQQKTNEIARLKGEVTALESRTPPHYHDQTSRDMQRRLQGEIQSLEQYIQQVEEEQVEIRKDKDKAKEQLRNIEKEASMWNERFFESERNFESLSDHSNKQEVELQALQVHCMELTTMLEELRTKSHDSSMNETLPCVEDLARSVVEVQLRDALKENEELSENLRKVQEEFETLEAALGRVNENYQQSEIFKEQFKTKLESLEPVYENTRKQLIEALSNINLHKQQYQLLETEFLNTKTISEKLQFEYEEAIIENQKLEAEVETLLVARSTFLLKLRDFDTAQKSLETHLLGTQNRFEQLASEFEELKMNNSATRKELEESWLHSRKLEQEVTNLVTKCDHLEQENNKLVTDTRTLQQQLATTLENLEKLDQHSQEIENERNEFEQELKVEQFYVEQLKNQLLETQTARQVIEDELSKVQNQLSVEKVDKQELLKKVNDSNDTCKLLEVNIERVVKENKEIEEQLTDTINNLNSTSDQVETMKQQNKNLELDINQSQSVTESLRKQLETLNEENKKINDLLNSMEMKVQEAENAKKDGDKKNEELSVVFENLQEELCVTQNRLRLSLDEVAELNVANNNVERDLSQAELMIETLKTDIHELGSDNENIIAELEEKENLATKLRDNNELLRVKLKKAETKYVYLQEDAKSGCEALKQQLTEADEKNKLIEIQLEKSEKSFDMRLNEIGAVLKSKIEEIALLSTENETHKKQRNLAEMELLEIQQKQSDLMTKFVTLTQTNTQLLQENEILQEQITVTSAKLEETKLELEILKNSQNCLDLKLKQFEVALEQKDHEVELVNQERNEIDQKYMQMQANENLLKNNISNSESKLKEVQICTENLRRNLEKIEAEKDKYQKLWGDVKITVKDLEQEKEHLLWKTMLLEDDNKKLRTNNEEFQVKITNTSHLVEDRIKIHEELERRLNYISNCKEDIEKDNMLINENLKEITQKNNFIENQLSQRVQEIEEQCKQLQKVNDEKVILEKSAAELRFELENVKISNQEKVELLYKTEETLKKLENRNEILNTKLKVLEVQHRELAENHDSLENEIRDANLARKVSESELKEVSVKLKEIELERLEAQKAAADQQAERDSLLENVCESKKLNEELKFLNESIQVKLCETENKVTELEDRKVSLQQQFNETSNNLLSTQTQHEQLKHKLLEKEEENANLLKSLEDLGRSFEAVQREKVDFEQKLLDGQILLGDADINAENIKKNLVLVQEEKVKQEEHNSILQERIHNLEEVIKKIEKKVKDNEDIKTQLSSVEIHSNNLREELKINANSLERVKVEKLCLETKQLEDEKTIKSLKETLQDYELTISGLKSVIDKDCQNLENLKMQVSESHIKDRNIISAIADILGINVICDQSDQIDVLTLLSQELKNLLHAKTVEEKRRLVLEEEIDEIKKANIFQTNINTSLQEMVKKLQGLVMDQSEICSFDALKNSFDLVHVKITDALKGKQKLEDEKNKLENDNRELTNQFKVVEEQKDALKKTLTQLEEKVKNLENLNKTNKVDKENILGVSTKGNKTREDELKKENTLLKKKIVLVEHTKNNLEKVVKELREEKKRKMPSPTDDALYKKLLNEYIEVKGENERIIAEKETIVKQLMEEKERLKHIIEAKDQRQVSEHVNVESNQKLVHDLQTMREAYGNVLSANSKLELEIVTVRKLLEDRASEMGDLFHIKDAYEKLLEENNKAVTEIDTIKYKRMRDKEEFVRIIKKERDENSNKEMKKIQEIRSEYEGKLEKMKEKMLKLYRDEMNKKVRSVKDGKNETEHLLKTLANLRAELFDADQKIQLLEVERDILKTNRKFQDSNMLPLQQVSSLTSLNRNERASTLPRSSITQEITISRRTSIGAIPNLPMEDEEELFNNKYLTDLKEGRLAFPVGGDSASRFSELVMRNSMVPPHLKSSYPTEMQFISPTRFKDEDLKTGHIEFDDSLSKLLPSEKPRKKDFGTTSYKKPGPPTPSKNGGRLSLQGNEVHPMREHCEAKTPKKSTPSRIKALFTGRTSINNSESQSSTTPNRGGRRLNIFRKPR